MDFKIIKDKESVLCSQELITDTDADADFVKQTIKSFTYEYHQYLRLLSLGELEEEVVLRSWSSVNEVVDRLFELVNKCSNLGIILRLLRFVEVAVLAHLGFNVSKYPSVFKRGEVVIETGLMAIKDLVSTPYVEGSLFLYGIKALISITCRKSDLLEPVTEFLKKCINFLPPTLFDHNVRSLNKTLQRHLFRLLRNADTLELKEKLIDLMIIVGFQRKDIAPYAPRVHLLRKRSFPESLRDMSSIEKQNLPEKKLRLDIYIEPKKGNINPYPDPTL